MKIDCFGANLSKYNTILEFAESSSSTGLLLIDKSSCFITKMETCLKNIEYIIYVFDSGSSIASKYIKVKDKITHINKNDIKLNESMVESFFKKMIKSIISLINSKDDTFCSFYNIDTSEEAMKTNRIKNDINDGFGKVSLKYSDFMYLNLLDVLSTVDGFLKENDWNFLITELVHEKEFMNLLFGVSSEKAFEYIIKEYAKSILLWTDEYTAEMIKDGKIIRNSELYNKIAKNKIIFKDYYNYIGKKCTINTFDTVKNGVIENIDLTQEVPTLYLKNIRKGYIIELTEIKKISIYE